MQRKRGRQFKEPRSAVDQDMDNQHMDGHMDGADYSDLIAARPRPLRSARARPAPAPSPHSEWEAGDGAPPRKGRRTEDTPDAAKSRFVRPTSAPASASADGPSSAAADALDAALRELLLQLSPTKAERQRRVAAFRFVTDAVLSPLRLHGAVYGSCATGVLLPGSDVDMCVSPQPIIRERVAAASPVGGLGPRRSRGAPPEFSSVLRALRKSRVVRGVVPIAHARVPIIKFVHAETGTDVDISFMTDGVGTSEYLLEEFDETPMARCVVLLVKLLLAKWKLNDPADGGLGSFVTSLLVLWYIRAQVEESFPLKAQRNVGAVFVGFLRFYGTDFPHSRLAIDLARNRVFDKPATTELRVVNPLNATHNAASAAFKFGSHVRPRFAKAATLFESLAATQGGPALTAAVAAALTNDGPTLQRRWPSHELHSAVAAARMQQRPVSPVVPVTAPLSSAAPKRTWHPNTANADPASAEHFFDGLFRPPAGSDPAPQRPPRRPQSPPPFFVE